MTRDDLHRSLDLARSCTGYHASAMLAYDEGITANVGYLIKLARQQYTELGKAMDALDAVQIPQPQESHHG